APGDVGGEVVGGRAARGEAGAVRGSGYDAVDAEDAPVLPVQVPGDQVPTPLGAHQPVRFDAAAAGRAVVPAVLEAQLLAVAAQVGEFGEQTGVHAGGRVAQHRHGEGVQGADAAAQPVGQHLLQLGQ